MRILLSLQITATALVFAVLPGNSAEAANAAQGEHAFVKCAICHAKDKTNVIRPGLSGVIGRHAKMSIPSRNLRHGGLPGYAAAGFIFRLASSLRSTSATIASRAG